MKKLFTLLLALLLVTTAFVGCSKSKGPGNEEKVDLNVDKQIEAELTISIPGGNKNEQTMIDCLIEDFEEEYPNVTISKDYISIDNYASEISRKALAGSLSDIIWSNSPDFYDLLEADILAKLNPYIAASEAAGAFNFEDDFYTEYFDMGSNAGNYYVVPRSCDSIVTFYNKDIFTKAGVDMSKVKNGWTWQDMLDACALIRPWMDKNGMSGNYVLDANLTSWLSVCYPLLNSYGVEVIDENGTNVIDCPETKEVVEMIREMVENRYIIDSTMASTASFETGGSAMIFQSVSVSFYADRVALKGKIDLVSFPLVTAKGTPKIGAGIAGYAITQQSKNKNLAWLFLQHLLSYDGQQNMALNGLNLASIRKNLSDPQTANWGQQYKHLNLQAYTFGSEYKVACEFFTRTDLTAKAGIDQALRNMFTDATNKSKDITKLIASCKEAISDAMIGY